MCNSGTEMHKSALQMSSTIICSDKNDSSKFNYFAKYEGGKTFKQPTQGLNALKRNYMVSKLCFSGPFHFKNVEVECSNNCDLSYDRSG